MVSRRTFLAGAAAAAGQTVFPAGAAGTPSFFTTAKRHGRWWFITPAGRLFFSIGLNHIDAATLRYAENVHLWRTKYGNSMRRWLQEAVAPDLKAWGFNTVGWVQEVVTRGQTNHRHSRNFTFEEYQWLGIPYCHMLPFADFHQWEAETRHPDLFSQDFEDWCDYVARAHCARFAGDPKLVGYFYLDCPTWVHVRKENAWRGPLFDPQKLRTDAGKRELHKLATRYYKVTHDAIRRYDKNHLILGDRYEARAPLPEEVVSAALPFVDVLSFQCFGGVETVRGQLGKWAAFADKPILLADSAVRRKPRESERHAGAPRHTDPVAYRQVTEALRAMAGCVGFHLCGAYLCNRARRSGLRSEQDRPDEEAIRGITATNQATAAWVEGFAAESDTAG
jgi:hypothetical protein